MSCTCVILAGGTSFRMKEDKALLFDNVNQLNQRLTDLGFTTVIACGNKTESTFSMETAPQIPLMPTLFQM